MARAVEEYERLGRWRKHQSIADSRWFIPLTAGFTMVGVATIFVLYYAVPRERSSEPSDLLAEIIRETPPLPADAPNSVISLRSPVEAASGTAGPVIHSTPPAPNRRLPNGSLIRSTALVGDGKLSVENGNSFDAGIKLVDVRESCVLYFYVRSNDEFHIEGIPDGAYRVMYALGEDWNIESQMFNRVSSAQAFDRNVEFTTETKLEGAELWAVASEYALSLHPVLNGNAHTSAIDPEQFARY